MTRVVLPTAVRVDAPAACADCRQRDEAIQRLTHELAGCRTRIQRLSCVWMGLGIALLSILPPAMLWAFFVLVELYQFDAQAVVMPLYGLVVSAVMAAPAVMALVATLHWQSFWRRGLVFALGFALFLICLNTAGAILGEDFGWTFLTAASVYPGMLLIALLPALFMRLTRRWNLAPREADAQPRAASLATLLIATALCATAAANLRGWGGWIDSEAGEAGVSLMVLAFGFPFALTIGLTLTAGLWAAMIRRPLGAWLAAAAVVVASALTLSAVATLLFALATANGNGAAMNELWGIALMSSFAGIGSALTGLVSFAALRWLGYHLLSAGSRRRRHQAARSKAIRSSREIARNADG